MTLKKYLAICQIGLAASLLYSVMVEGSLVVPTFFAFVENECAGLKWESLHNIEPMNS